VTDTCWTSLSARNVSSTSTVQIEEVLVLHCESSSG